MARYRGGGVLRTEWVGILKRDTRQRAVPVYEGHVFAKIDNFDQAHTSRYYVDHRGADWPSTLFERLEVSVAQPSIKKRSLAMTLPALSECIATQFSAGAGAGIGDKQFFCSTRQCQSLCEHQPP